jgi:hypothetical protein
MPWTKLWKITTGELTNASTAERYKRLGPAPTLVADGRPWGAPVPIVNGVWSIADRTSGATTRKAYVTPGVTVANNHLVVNYPIDATKKFRVRATVGSGSFGFFSELTFLTSDPEFLLTRNNSETDRLGDNGTFITYSNWLGRTLEQVGWIPGTNWSVGPSANGYYQVEIVYTPGPTSTITAAWWNLAQNPDVDSPQGTLSATHGPPPRDFVFLAFPHKHAAISDIQIDIDDASAFSAEETYGDTLRALRYRSAGRGANATGVGTTLNSLTFTTSAHRKILTARSAGYDPIIDIYGAWGLSETTVAAQNAKINLQVNSGPIVTGTWMPSNTTGVAARTLGNAAFCRFPGVTFNAGDTITLYFWLDGGFYIASNWQDNGTVRNAASGDIDTGGSMPWANIGGHNIPAFGFRARGVTKPSFVVVGDSVDTTYGPQGIDQAGFPVYDEAQAGASTQNFIFPIWAYWKQRRTKWFGDVAVVGFRKNDLPLDVLVGDYVKGITRLRMLLNTLGIGQVLWLGPTPVCKVDGVQPVAGDWTALHTQPVALNAPGQRGWFIERLVKEAFCGALHGDAYIDPARAVRDAATRQWVASTTGDGVHPSSYTNLINNLASDVSGWVSTEYNLGIGENDVTLGATTQVSVNETTYTQVAPAGSVRIYNEKRTPLRLIVAVSQPSPTASGERIDELIGFRFEAVTTAPVWVRSERGTFDIVVSAS